MTVQEIANEFEISDGSALPILADNLDVCSVAEIYSHAFMWVKRALPWHSIGL